MNNKFSLGALIVVAIIAISALVTSVEVVPEPVVRLAGTEENNRIFLNSGSTNGGRLATTSSATAYTTVASDFVGTPTYIDWTPNVNTTISISATSTYEYVPNVGDVATVYLRNASSTAAATITLAAANANVDLQDNEDSADLAIAGLDWAELTFIRESATLVTVLVNEFTEAD